MNEDDAVTSVPISTHVDRLIHASDGQDARVALDALIARTQSNKKKQLTELDKDRVSILENEQCISCVFNLIAGGMIHVSEQDETDFDETTDADHNRTVVVEDGTSLGCDLISNMLESDSKHGVDAAKVLLLHYVGAGSAKFGLVHCLLDALSSSTVYPFEKIQVISLLRILLRIKPQRMQESLISAPDGMHRAVLEPAFGITTTDQIIIPEETVRNEALVLAKEFAAKSPICRQLLIFNSGLEYAIRIAIELEGGLLNLPASKSVIMDCLALCHILVSEEEAGGQELLGSKTCMMLLMNLLDLRNGCEARMVSTGDNKEGDQTIEEDMDDLLGRPSGAKGGNRKNQAKKKNQKQKRLVLTDSENEVIGAVLSLLTAAIVSTGTKSPSYKKGREQRQTLFVKQEEVSRAVLGMALYDLGVKFPFTITDPTENVQVAALHLIAELGQDAPDSTKNEILAKPSFYWRDDRRNVGDRFLALTRSCSRPVAIAGFAAFRSVMTIESASMNVMHTLAPPPVEDDLGISPTAPPLQMVLDLLASSLLTTIDQNSVGDEITDRIISICGMLGVILTNGGIMVREMLLRLTIGNEKQNLLVTLLQWLEHDFVATSTLDNWSNAKTAIIRLLCEWCVDCQTVVKEMLSSPENTGLIASLNQVATADSTQFQPGLFCLLIGLWLELLVRGRVSFSQTII